MEFDNTARLYVLVNKKPYYNDNDNIYTFEHIE
jgi:hypothetical protein